MSDTPCIAIVDDEPAQRELLSAALRSAGYATRPCADGAEALQAAPECDLMLLDVRLPGMSGLEVMERVRKEVPALPVILLTAFIDVRDAVAAIKAGRWTTSKSPWTSDELEAAVDDALGSQAPRPSEPVSIPPHVVAESAAMRQPLWPSGARGPTRLTVLILGESGVGKEVVARLSMSPARGRRCL
jgi:DNA-binding NtrC family response regulator